MISDLSANELVNINRLKKAAHLIKITNMKIYKVTEMVGYKSQTSFGRNFQIEREACCGAIRMSSLWNIDSVIKQKTAKMLSFVFM